MLRYAVFLLALGCSQADRVLDPSRDGNPGEILYRWLDAQLAARFEARRRQVATIRTPAAVAQRSRWIRKTLTEIAGGFPERTPLAPRVVGRIRRTGYAIEKVVYDSRPGFSVTANLYLPDGLAAPAPGVLIPCGHSRAGKAEPAYQRMAISLAQHGMVALVYDPIGQGERMQLLDSSGRPKTWGTTEHTLVGIGALLVGLGTAHYRIWDGIRSLDYLASRKEVDPSKLGCTGNSGGGTLTSYLMALDERIVAAAPSCYLTTLERLFATIGPQDAEQNFPGQIALGLEHADFLTARIPKPTLMLVATRDFFAIDGSWTCFREAKRLYCTAGFGERVDLFEFDDTHGFSKPRRTAALRFMRRWLQGRDEPVDERTMTLSTDAELRCTKSGQVLADGRGPNVIDLDVARERSLRDRRAKLWTTPEKALAEVRRLAAIASEIAGPEVEEVASESSGPQKLVLRRTGQPPVPALLHRPRPVTRGPVVVWVSSRGKSAHAEATARLVEAGKSVLALDVRGIGETRTDKGRRFKTASGSDVAAALLAQHLGRPLLGERVEDVLAAVEWLAREPRVESIEVVGYGHMGPVALHAAALDTRIQKLTIQRSIRSWAEVVAHEVPRDQWQNVVPFALEAYDLPDLVRAIRPREVVIEQPVDAAGKRID